MSLYQGTVTLYDENDDVITVERAYGDTYDTCSAALGATRRQLEDQHEGSNGIVSNPCEVVTTADTDFGNTKFALNGMSDSELVAYWNIMQFPGPVVGGGQYEQHRPIVDELLNERNIPHVHGKRTTFVVS